MPAIVVCPLSRIAEAAVAHRAGSMVSLLAEGQSFHRPATIGADRHLTLGVNDIAAAMDGLVLAQEDHVARLIAFVRDWDRAEPMLIHCWMGISRSPAAALIAALALRPDQDDGALAARLKKTAPFVTPNPRLVAIGDAMLGRGGALAAAVAAMGRGADAFEGAPFVLEIAEPAPDER